MAEQIPDGAARDLLELLTTTDRLTELLPVLHTHAVAAVGGKAAILFQFDRERDWLQATSGFAVNELPTQPWMPLPRPDQVTPFHFAQPLAGMKVEPTCWKLPVT